MSGFFIDRLDYIYFLYGVCLLALASISAVLAQGRHMRMPWPLLCAFAITHGASDWLDMIALSLGSGPVFETAQTGFLVLSLAFLFEFGRAACASHYPRFPGRWLTLAAVLASLPGLADGALGLRVVSRHLLGGLGALLSAWALLHQVRGSTDKAHRPLRFTAWCLVAYAFLISLFGPFSGIFTLPVLNDTWFFQQFGLPVVLLHALITLAITAGLWQYARSDAEELKDSAIRPLLSGTAPRVVIVVVFVGVFGYPLTEWSSLYGRNFFEDSTVDRAQIIALSIRPDVVVRLQGEPADAGRDEYREIKQQLELLDLFDKQAVRIYVTQLQDHRVVGLVDSLLPDDPSFVPPGFVYAEASREFRNAAASGHPVFLQPYTDRFGSWISVLVPVRLDEDQSRRIFMGMDIPARYYYQFVAGYRLVAILILIFLVLCTLAAGVLAGVGKAGEWADKLAASERKFRTLYDLTPHAVLLVNAQGLVQDCNVAALRMFRLTPERAASLLLDTLLPADNRSMLRDLLQHLRQPRWAGELNLQRLDGDIFPAQISTSEVVIEGQPRILLNVSDLSERRQEEEQRNQLVTAIRQAAESVIITDIQGRIQYVNPAFERLTGYTADDVRGQNPRLLKTGRQNDDFYHQMWSSMMRGELFVGRFVNRRKDGTLFVWDSTISPVRDAAGKLTNFVAVSRDVSREVQLEEDLRQSQKMEAVGRLAGGVAHDFNNLLTVILGNVDILLSREDIELLKPPELTEIRTATIRAAALTNQLLTFSRRQVVKPVTLDLNHTVRDLNKMLHRLIGENIDLHYNLHDGAVLVRIDPTQLEQIIMNLLLNARDAMPHGGRLTIETQVLELEEAKALRLSDVEPGAFAVLVISDSGLGMDEYVRTHLFEPFFTTKERGKGTGLGLATVYGAVLQNKGHVSVYSDPGQGSTFRVYLPLADTAGGAADRLEQRPEIRGGNETILVIEDDDAVRLLASGILREAGYKTLEAVHGDDALQVAAAYAGEIHMVLTDVIMPGLACTEIVRRLSLQRPNTRVLFMSGHPDTTIVKLGVLASGLAFLKKPFSRQDLLARLREVLDGT